MAQVPVANVAQAQKFYNDATFTGRQFDSFTIGQPNVGASGEVTGNGNYSIFTAGANAHVYSVTVTVVGVGTGAGASLQAHLLSANNNANVSQNVALGNVMNIGVNVAGNVYTSGPLSYNVFANGVVSGSNIAPPGGVTVNVGDTLYVVLTGNTSYLGGSVEYSVDPSAILTA